MERLLEKLIRLPMDVMISSMETMTRTMQEIQHRSEAAERGAGKSAKPSALGNAPRLAVTPLFEMYKIPTSGLASGIKTLSQAMDDIRHGDTGKVAGEAAPEEAEFDAEIVPLDDPEASRARHAALFADDLDKAGATLWQIGRPGRTDYPGTWTEVFDYRVGKDIDAVNAPQMPHLIAVHGGPQSVGATERLNVHFTLRRAYPAGALALAYDRWGGEKDSVFVDDVLLAPVRGAGRGRLRSVALKLGELTRGDHVISITAAGETTEREHRIDSLRLLEVKPAGAARQTKESKEAADAKVPAGPA